jgi:hypothetical protein
MENLRQVLGLLNLPSDRVDLVQQRVEARLSKETPGSWCHEFRRRAEALLAAEPFTPAYAEQYQGLRGLLSRQGIAVYSGEHGMAVPDEEVDVTPKKPAATRPPLPLDFVPRRDKSVPFVAPTPPLPGEMTVSTEPPVVTGSLAPAASDSEAVLGGELPLDMNQPTPPHRDHIEGGYCQRNDDAWVVECSILRGARVQVCTITEDNQDVSFEADITVPVQRLELRLPHGARPKTTVIVVLGAQGEEMGRGLIGVTVQ